MASIHRLYRIKAVITLYNAHKKNGLSDAFIFREYIYPTYPMSRATFYEYLACPVDRLLKEKQLNETKSDIYF